jgi:ElaA protein
MNGIAVHRSVALSDIQWRFVAFASLSPQQLYAALQLRGEVFMVEQDCVFQDMDGADDQAMHLLGIRGGELLAYARCFPRGVKFAQASIGRVLTRASARGLGLGHVLMREAIDGLTGHWGPQPISIGAQARLEGFYRQHGFVPIGEPYIEDGIPHIEMLRQS